MRVGGGGGGKVVVSALERALAAAAAAAAAGEEDMRADDEGEQSRLQGRLQGEQRRLQYDGRGQYDGDEGGQEDDNVMSRGDVGGDGEEDDGEAVGGHLSQWDQDYTQRVDDSDDEHEQEQQESDRPPLNSDDSRRGRVEEAPQQMHVSERAEGTGRGDSAPPIRPSIGGGRGIVVGIAQQNLMGGVGGGGAAVNGRPAAPALAFKSRTSRFGKRR